MSRCVWAFGRAKGNNPVRVQIFVGPEVVPLDVVPVAGFSNAGQFQHSIDKRMKVRIVNDSAKVALEVNHVDQVKPYQRREQAKVGFGERSFAVTHQPCSAGHVRFEFIQTSEQCGDGTLVSVLGTGES